MKKYIYHFRYVFGTLLVLGAFIGITIGLHNVVSKMSEKPRENTVCTTRERVFDYADKLTDKQEDKLEKLIAKREAQTGCDIVLVTLNESLQDYMEETNLAYSYLQEEYVMVYADDFYDGHKFGYDKPYGDGVIYVDNWHRESNGNCYTWFSTSGRAEIKYSNAMIDHLIDKVCTYTNISPYYSYRTYVNTFYYDMCGVIPFTYRMPVAVILALAALFTFLYLWFHLSDNRGKKTTGANTYVNGGNSDVIRQEDILVNEFVTRRHIERSSGSGGGSHGGGGHHTSSGGHSHGGGGGHH